MKVSRREAIKTSLLTGFGLMFSGGVIAADCLTTGDIEGPYYIPGSKLTSKLSPSGAPGIALMISGSVYANDCITPIKNAVVDVWHANDGGGYENENYRGIIMTDDSGKYAFATVLPGKYLNGPQYRPRHLHYKVSAPDVNSSLVLTTQIYFEGDTSIPIDPWASDPDAAERIIPLTLAQNNTRHGVVDFVIDIDPSALTGVTDLDAPAKTLVQSIQPNPVHESAEVIFSLSRSAVISIKVYNINGQEIVKLVDDKIMGAGKHKLPFNSQNQHGLKMNSGVYIMKLCEDGISRDVKRFVVR